MKYTIDRSRPIPQDALGVVKFKYPTIVRNVGDEILRDGRKRQIVRVEHKRKSIVYHVTQ